MPGWGRMLFCDRRDSQNLLFSCSRRNFVLFCLGKRRALVHRIQGRVRRNVEVGMERVTYAVFYAPSAGLVRALAGHVESAFNSLPTWRVCCRGGARLLCGAVRFAGVARSGGMRSRESFT